MSIDRLKPIANTFSILNIISVDVLSSYFEESLKFSTKNTVPLYEVEHIASMIDAKTTKNLTRVSLFSSSIANRVD
jgi:hypothetical protein